VRHGTRQGACEAARLPALTCLGPSAHMLETQRAHTWEVRRGAHKHVRDLRHEDEPRRVVAVVVQQHLAQVERAHLVLALRGRAGRSLQPATQGICANARTE